MMMMMMMLFSSRTGRNAFQRCPWLNSSCLLASASQRKSLDMMMTMMMMMLMMMMIMMMLNARKYANMSVTKTYLEEPVCPGPGPLEDGDDAVQYRDATSRPLLSFCYPFVILTCLNLHHRVGITKKVMRKTILHFTCLCTFQMQRSWLRFFQWKS